MIDLPRLHLLLTKWSLRTRRRDSVVVLRPAPPRGKITNYGSSTSLTMTLEVVVGNADLTDLRALVQLNRLRAQLAEIRERRRRQAGGWGRPGPGLFGCGAGGRPGPGLNGLDMDTPSRMQRWVCGAAPNLEGKAGLGRWPAGLIRSGGGPWRRRLRSNAATLSGLLDGGGDGEERSGPYLFRPYLFRPVTATCPVWCLVSGFPDFLADAGRRGVSSLLR
jgi:hypothetical protein